jgi:hypothetical protein
MANSVAIDDLDNAVGGYGSVVDLASQLGIACGPAAGNPSVTCHGGVVGETGITAGAVQLQLGTAGATGIVWSTLGSATTVTAGGGATISAPSALAGATHARVVVSTPIVGGKATAIVTV